MIVGQGGSLGKWRATPDETIGHPVATKADAQLADSRRFGWTRSAAVTIMASLGRGPRNGEWSDTTDLCISKQARTGEHYVPDQNTATKNCIVCGEDCSQRDRVKDRQGRYICKPCYEKAKQKKAAAAEAKKKAKPAADAGKNGATPSFDLSLFQELADQERTAPALDVVASICPHCRKPRERWVPVCPECGYNIQTGMRVNVDHLKK